uniref:Uncharacterized protein n=1 Tax=Anopheles dirus TaxID=7168 RepID=A0A182NXR0_9DIPT
MEVTPGRLECLS